MNWIEIDKMIVSLIQAGNDHEQIHKDMMKQFKWSRSQAEAAIKPLIARTPMPEVQPKKVTKTKRQPKKVATPKAKK